jgi:hypothetical protein
MCGVLRTNAFVADYSSGSPEKRHIGLREIGEVRTRRCAPNYDSAMDSSAEHDLMPVFTLVHELRDPVIVGLSLDSYQRSQ